MCYCGSLEEERRGRMGISWVFVGMVIATLFNVSDSVASKSAMSAGFSKYILAVYTNALSTLLLLPISFFLHRSERPQFSFSILASIVLLSFFGGTALLFGYAGIQYSSPTLDNAMLNLVPAFTFLIALLFRMEKLDLRVSSSQAKLAGTMVSITGAFVLTFYKEVPIIFHSSVISGLTHETLSSPPENWILGGFLCLCHATGAALWYIYQAPILKKYPAVMIVVPLYSFFVAIQSAIISLVAEKDPSAWRLEPDKGLVSVVYIVVFSTLYRCITMTCVRIAGPLYVSMFKPLGIVGAAVMSIIFLGETLYLGSVAGAIVIAVGFYVFMWGKAKEEKKGEATQVESLESPSQLRAPILRS